MPIIIIFFFLFSSILLLIAAQNTKAVQQVVHIFVGFCLILIAGFRPEDSVFDYLNYVSIFNNIKEGDTAAWVEPTFHLISHISSSSLMLFVIYALLGVSIKIYAIKKLSNLVSLSIICYISYYFLLHEMTQIRVGVAAGLLLLSIYYIYNKDLKRFIFVTVIAVLFHASALIMVPLWFFGNKPRKTALLLAVPIALFTYFLGISIIDIISLLPIPFMSQKFQYYQELAEIGQDVSNQINVFHPLFLSKVFIYYLLLFKYDLIIENNKYAVLLMKCYCLSLCSYLILTFMPTVSLRISELYGIVEIILYPMIYYIIKPKSLGAFIAYFIAFLYLCFFVYMLIS